MRATLMLLSMVLVLSVALIAPAKTPPHDDALTIVGLYGLNCYNQAYPEGIQTCYLVLRSCSSPGGVRGWECRITTEGHGVITATRPRGQWIDGDSAPDGFKVGLAQALPHETDLVLMEIDFFLFPPEQDIMMYIEANYRPSMPGGLPIYLDGNDVMLLKHMRPYSHTFDYGEDFIFGVNTGCGPVATETNSWGAVKRLYR